MESLLIEQMREGGYGEESSRNAGLETSGRKIDPGAWVATGSVWSHAWQWSFALAFAAVLVWIPSEGLRDRGNYLAYLDNAPILLAGWLDGSVLSILANEPLWILVNVGLSLLMERETALQMLIFFPALQVARQVLRFDSRRTLLLLAFLLIPLVVKNHVVHLRQGLAIAVFLTAWYAPSRVWRWLLMLTTPFFHSSFFFVLMLLAVAAALRRLRVPTVLVIAVYALLGGLVGVGLGGLARAVGARQGEEAQFDSAADVSGLGFVFWSAALGLYLLQSRRFRREHILETGALVFYLATYFLSPFTARVFESTLLIFLLSMLRMKGNVGRLLIASVLLFSLLQWLLLYLGLRSVFTEI